MDRTDAQIMHFFTTPGGFQMNLRPSYADAARSIGISEDAARSRMKRMQDSGFIQGWDLMVNPNVLDMTLVRVEVPIPDGPGKDSLLTQAKELEGTRLILDYQHTGFVWIGYVTSADRMARLLGSLAGVDTTTCSLAVPPCSGMPKGGWDLLLALRGDPRRTLTEVAKRLSVTTRTVRRRLETLTASGAAFVVAKADFEHLTGALPFELRIRMDEDADRSAAHKAAMGLDRLIFSITCDDVIIATTMAPNAAAASRMRDHMSSMRGLTVQMDLIRTHTLYDDWLSEAISRRASQASA